MSRVSIEEQVSRLLHELTPEPPRQVTAAQVTAIDPRAARRADPCPAAVAGRRRCGRRPGAHRRDPRRCPSPRQPRPGHERGCSDCLTGGNPFDVGHGNCIAASRGPHGAVSDVAPGSPPGAAAVPPGGVGAGDRRPRLVGAGSHRGCWGDVDAGAVARGVRAVPDAADRDTRRRGRGGVVAGVGGAAQRGAGDGVPVRGRGHHLAGRRHGHDPQWRHRGAVPRRRARLADHRGARWDAQPGHAAAVGHQRRWADLAAGRHLRRQAPGSCSRCAPSRR